MILSNQLKNKTASIKKLVKKSCKFLFNGEWKGLGNYLVSEILNILNEKNIIRNERNLHCSLCNYSSSSFLHKSNSFGISWNSACPCCDSRSRHRGLIFIYRRYLNIQVGKKILHFAPEPLLEYEIRQHKDHEYYTTDFKMENVKPPSDSMAQISELLTTLSPDEKRLVECAAYIGSEFNASTLSTALQIPRLEALVNLRRLEKKGLIKDILDQDDVYSFTSTSVLNGVRYITSNFSDANKNISQIVREYQRRITISLEKKFKIDISDEATLDKIDDHTIYKLAKRSMAAGDIMLDKALIYNKVAQNRSMKSKFYLFFKGVAMGAADIVPGVSGGTIALITGIYEELIESIKNINLNLFRTLFTKGFKSFWKELNGNFLLTLALGIMSAILLLAQFISYLLLNHEFKIWGFFFGLIFSSAILIYREVTNISSSSVTFLILGILIASIISISGPTTTPNNYFFIFLTGSIAICAMILPGISGSFILLLFSKYEFIINSIKEFKIDVLIVFAMGCIVGLLLFSRFLSYLFKNYKDYVLSLLSGFLFGSLFKVWPFKLILQTRINSDGITEPFITRPALPNAGNSEEIIFFILFSLFGYLLIYFLQKKSVQENKE